LGVAFLLRIMHFYASWLFLMKTLKDEQYVVIKACKFTIFEILIGGKKLPVACKSSYFDEDI